MSHPGKVISETAAGARLESTRRQELGAFLRACRSRVTPEAVGLPPGSRRRTPGLRREEVAQLAAVSVTWYTWLEQGRSIQASEHVITAIARTLRLQPAEREHLYRLADLTPAGSPGESPLRPEVQTVLDALDPLAAAVVGPRHDILARNRTHAVIHPGIGPSSGQPPAYRHNTLWHSFVVPDCCNAYADRHEEHPRLVGLLRANYGTHVGKPEWEQFIADLKAVSPRFRELWDLQQVAAPAGTLKRLKHPSVGELRMTTSVFAVLSAPGARMLVYVPADEETRRRVSWLREHPEAGVATHAH